MKPPPFQYHAPEALGEAIDLLADLGEGGRVLAGGQSLMPMLNLRLARPDAVVDLNRIEELRYHRVEGDRLVVGALCRHRDIERDHAVLSRCAALADAVPLIGHVGIRNRGTVVGSLAHADPAAEWPLLAVLLEATIEVQGLGGRRSIPAEQFFTGVFATALEPGELIVEAAFRLPAPGTGSAFVEVARRHGDFALGAAGALVFPEDGENPPPARLVVGGFDAMPVSVPADPEAVGEHIHPADDIHAPAGYRVELAKTLCRRALELAARRREEGASA